MYQHLHKRRLDFCVRTYIHRPYRVLPPAPHPATESEDPSCSSSIPASIRLHLSSGTPSPRDLSPPALSGWHPDERSDSSTVQPYPVYHGVWSPAILASPIHYPQPSSTSSSTTSQTVDGFILTRQHTMADTAPPPPLDPALYESRAYIPITVVSVCLAVASISVALRSYTRAVLLNQFGPDDWAAIVALILAIGSGTMVALSMSQK
jgi:hypothetical protein